MKRLNRFGLCVIGAAALFFADGAGAATRAPERGTAERLARASNIRGYRAGTAATQVGTASAADHESMMLMLSLGRGIEQYARYNRIVFLSDGLLGMWQPLAEAVSSAYPDKLVIKGDYDLREAKRLGNLISAHIDNRVRLPLGDSSVDLVVMRRGLCLCHGATMCGGLSPTVPSMRRFMKDVYRVLDKANPNAVAYLHGGYGGPARLMAFRRAADELQAQSPSMRVEFVESQMGFQAVRIGHAL